MKDATVINHTCDVKLTEEELLSRGKLLTEFLQEIQNLEDRKREAMAKFKAQIEEQRNKLFYHSRVVQFGVEERELECTRVYDLVSNHVIFISKESGQEVDRRPMKSNEIAAAQQYQFDFEWNETIDELLNGPEEGEKSPESGDSPDTGEDTPDKESDDDSPESGPDTLGPGDGLDDEELPPHEPDQPEGF